MAVLPSGSSRSQGAPSNRRRPIQTSQAEFRRCFRHRDCGLARCRCRNRNTVSLHAEPPLGSDRLYGIGDLWCAGLRLHSCHRCAWHRCLAKCVCLFAKGRPSVRRNRMVGGRIRGGRLSGPCFVPDRSGFTIAWRTVHARRVCARPLPSKGNDLLCPAGGLSAYLPLDLANHFRVVRSCTAMPVTEVGSAVQCGRGISPGCDNAFCWS